MFLELSIIGYKDKVFVNTDYVKRIEQHYAGEGIGWKPSSNQLKTTTLNRNETVLWMSDGEPVIATNTLDDIRNQLHEK